MNRNNIILSGVFIFTMLIMNVASADTSTIQKDLQQCREAFVTSHNKNVTQIKAGAAKLEHLKLMKKILSELNKSNSDQKMTSAEMQENVMVMSHLLEMIVTEDLSKKISDLEVSY